MQFFFFGGGRGLIRCIMGDMQVAYGGLRVTWFIPRRLGRERCQHLVISFNSASGKLPTFPFSSLNPKIKIRILICCLYSFPTLRCSGEQLIKSLANSSCVIMSVILMTTLFYKALILQGEMWCWSRVGPKGLITVCHIKCFFFFALVTGSITSCSWQSASFEGVLVISLA